VTAAELILADLAGAQRALRDSSHAFDEAILGMQTALTAIAAANHAQAAAMDAVISATDRALVLVRTGGAQ
jgi:hypothetical protein